MVVGGGPAGCATTLALRHDGIPRVCLVDSGANRDPRVGETLPPTARPALKDLGVWDGFVNAGHEPCLGSCSCWGSDTVGHNDFVLSPYGPGWHLDRRQFDVWLLATARSQGAEVCAGKVLGWQADSPETIQLRVKYTGGAHAMLRARFIVDATGSRSAFTRLAGAGARFLDRLTFVYGFFDASAGCSSSQLTMLEAAQAGWWYAAPLPGRRLAVAFASDSDIVRRQGLAREETWFGALLQTHHIARRLDGCRFLRGSLIVRAAVSFLLDPVVGPRWVVVGDAAASYDPLSSQGIQKALEGGLRAAHAISEALSAHTELRSDYAASIVADFDDYRIGRNHFYQIEQRWPDAPFWRRRRQRTQVQHGRTVTDATLNN